MFDIFNEPGSTAWFLRIFGLYFVAAGIGVITNAKAMEQIMEEVRTNAMVRFMAGIIAFLTGVLILSVHNDWSSWQAGFVTFFGWAATIKGLLVLAMPAPLMAIWAGLAKSGILRVFAIGIIAFGALMLWQGFAG